MNNNIFISHNDVTSDNNISGKITYTNIIETIPPQKTTTKNENWKNEGKTEWRWRFLEFGKKKFVVEISFMKHDSDKRKFFNKYGEWVERDLDPVYDQYVVEEYFYYTDN